MRIGVFGDSFAEAGMTSSWYNFLQLAGHEVKSFGVGGSSILHSAKLIDVWARQFDLTIWAVTSPGRVTVQSGPNLLHLLPNGYTDTNDAFASDYVFSVYQNYLKCIYSERDDNFVSRAIIDWLSRKYPILCIPCFPSPLSADACLYDVSQQEAQFYFPNVDLSTVWSKHRDIRPGHLTQSNHKILAEQILKQLSPGTLKIDLAEFVLPDQPLETSFVRSTK